MNKFEKVSFEQYKEDYISLRGDIALAEESELFREYTDIKLPVRATKDSAGYDFFSPIDFELKPGETIHIKTGIRVFLDEGTFLMIVPRSGLGFKYRMQLDNVIGVIDQGYCLSDNEGHIAIKMTNDSREGKTCVVKKGEGIAQGIIVPFLKTDDDNATAVRNGGFGSTTKKN